MFAQRLFYQTITPLKPVGALEHEVTVASNDTIRWLDQIKPPPDASSRDEVQMGRPRLPFLGRLESILQTHSTDDAVCPHLSSKMANSAP